MSLFNRAKIIDKNFSDFVKSEKFPNQKLMYQKMVQTHLN